MKTSEHGPGGDNAPRPLSFVEVPVSGNYKGHPITGRWVRADSLRTRPLIGAKWEADDTEHFYVRSWLGESSIEFRLKKHPLTQRMTPEEFDVYSDRICQQITRILAEHAHNLGILPSRRTDSAS